MIVAPAVDLKGGWCVQLVGGRPDDERVSLPDPVGVAERWHGLGFGALHIVDLDAALGTGSNLELIERLIQATPAETQVGGGIRDDEAVEAVLSAGADRLIVGTRALEDPDWLAEVAGRHPNRVLLALDTKDGRILRKGWTEDTGLDMQGFLAGLESIPLAGILSTDVGREGLMDGIDEDACSFLIATCPHPVWISGGVTTTEELEHLEASGATGAVLGMSLYTETLNAQDVASRWGEPDGASKAHE
jgi:phosphoribosylformimino-5-aminoimidazole carboxamide ribotide isomerase